MTESSDLKNCMVAKMTTAGTMKCVINIGLTVVGITFQQTPALKVTADAAGYSVRQLGEFITGRCLDPTKAWIGPMPGINVDTMQKQHMEMNVEIERTAEALDQCHCAGLCRSHSKARLVRQVRGDGAVDNSQHLTHDSRLAGKQKA
jgi:hypothetical protein